MLAEPEDTGGQAGEETSGPAATWWRADRYEIVHGTHIRPKRSARIEPYPALGSYEKHWIGEGRARAAYVGLVNLDLDDNAAVLGWCSEFGLLGILHDRLVAAYFWPTWERRSVANPGSLEPRQTVLAEVGAHDHFPTRELRNTAISRTSAQVAEGSPLSDAEFRECFDPWSLTSAHQPNVLIRELWSLNQRAVDVVEGYGQFFPNVDGIPAWTRREAALHKGSPWAPPAWEGMREILARRSRLELNKAPYPLPGSRAFRQQYAEPRHLFYQVVHGFRAAIDDLTAQKFGRSSMRSAINIHGYRVPEQLAVGLRQVSPSLVWSEGRWSHAWEVRSLLAAMSIIAIQDLTKHGLVLCPGCGNRFFTTRRDKRHCEQGCGNAFRVRKSRAGARERGEADTGKEAVPL